MGDNGSFIYQSTACEDGRQWKTIATCGKIQIIEMKDRSKSNGMPAESHTPGRIYAMFRKDGKDVEALHSTVRMDRKFGKSIPVTTTLALRIITNGKIRAMENVERKRKPLS